jgi:hypothetical protein
MSLVQTVKYQLVKWGAGNPVTQAPLRAVPWKQGFEINLMRALFRCEKKAG